MLNVSAGQGVAALSSLTRLRLLVRECGKDQFALLKDISPSGGGSSTSLDAGILPGKSFYVWMQGWLQCTPPCVPADRAIPGDCTCIDRATPSSQVLVAESCSSWLKVPDGRIDVSLTLGPVRRGMGSLCPPGPDATCMNP